MWVGRILPERHIDMKDFNQRAISDTAREVLKTIKEPQRRAILENFIEHAESECTGDYDRLIASCSSKSQTYAVYGASEAIAEMQPKSVEEMKDFYRVLVESNVYMIHGEIEKLIVGDHDLYVEIILHQLYPGEVLPMAFGVEFGEEGEVWQLTQRVATVFCFDDENKGCAEHSWTDGPTKPEWLRKEDPRSVPAQFWNNPVTGPRKKPF
ncbi:MAG: hypothetical protein HPY82_01110 [Gammaproteobacteria bacterium]|nr:hypothetical protein [Gammaproteobacteria bacterium]